MALFYNVTRDSQSGTIFVKLVNRSDFTRDLPLSITVLKLRAAN